MLLRVPEELLLQYSCTGFNLTANACPYADLWMNCRELNSTWHKWLCAGENAEFCLATCRCGTDTIK